MKLLNIPAPAGNSRIFAVAVLLGTLCMAGYVCCCENIYRDVANAYLPLIRAFAEGDYAMAVHPALPPLQPLLAGMVAAVGLEEYPALMLVSGFFFVATLWPLRSLLRGFLGDRAAVWGCLLYVLTPKLIRFAGSGLLESGRNFFFTAALALLFSYLRAPSLKKAAWFGLTLGALALSRGEGIALGFMLTGWLVLSFLVRRRDCEIRENIRKFFPALVVIAVTFLVVVSPICVLNYHTVGYAVPDLRIAIALDRYLGDGTLGGDSLRRMPLSNRSFGNAFNNNLRGLYEPYVVLALVGAAVLWRRRKLCFDHLLIVVSVVGCFVMFYLSFAAYRYFTLNIPLLLLLVIPELYSLHEWFSRFRFGRQVFIIALAAIAVGQLVNGMEQAFSDENERENAFGRYLAASADRLVPGRPAGTPLRVYSESLAGALYFSRAVPCRRYLEAFDYEHDDDFDLAMFARRDAEDEPLARLLRRADLVEVEHPYQDEFVLLRNISPTDVPRPSQP